MRRAFLVSALALGGCMHVGLPHLGGSSTVAPAAAAVCPGELRADIPAEPQLPADADFPAATTPKAAAAVESASRWLTSHSQWGRDGWLRAQLAKDWCDGKR